MQRMKPKKMFQNENEVSEYAKKVFKQVDKRFVIPEEILEWGVGEMARYYMKAETRKIKQMVFKKIEHTKEVMRAGVDICLGTPEIDWNFTQVGLVCFLHDIGRFEQAMYGTFSDEISVDHARIGVGMFKVKEWPCLKEYDVDLRTLYETVDRHSRRVYKGKNNYVRLIRDADKIGILRNIPRDLMMDSLPDGPVSKEVAGRMNTETLVDYKYVKTKVDFYMAMLAWPKDFWFKVTYELYKESGASKWMKKQVLDQDPKLKGVLRLLEKSFEHHIVNLR